MGSALFSSLGCWDLLLSVLHDLLLNPFNTLTMRLLAFFVLLHIFVWDIHVLLPILSAEQKYLPLICMTYLAALISVCLD